MRVKGDIITNPKGAFFRGGKSAYLFPLALMFAIGVITGFLSGSWTAGLIMLFLTVILFPVVLDVRGFQLNMKKREIRIYKSYLFWKYGPWRKLDEFERIEVDYDSFTVRTADVLSNGSYTYEKNGHFLVTFKSKEEEKDIVATEEFKYPDALYKAQLLVEKTGLTLEDIFDEKLRVSKLNRAQRRSSRRR
ncbi:MAG: hypothetical protein AAF193_03410 [Bacteroidota bacterium]